MDIGNLYLTISNKIKNKNEYRIKDSFKSLIS